MVDLLLVVVFVSNVVVVDLLVAVALLLAVVVFVSNVVVVLLDVPVALLLAREVSKKFHMLYFTCISIERSDC